MKRLLGLLALCALPAWGQEFSALARLSPAESWVADDGKGLSVVLALSQPVPWRLKFLDAPPRLLVELRQVEWGAGPSLDPGEATALGTGETAGWSRLVVALAEPLGVTRAGMTVDSSAGGAVLSLRLDPVDPQTFQASAEATPPPNPAPEAAADAPLVIAIDPGHGGKDPGAERGDLRESRLTLALGLELAEALSRAGMVPVLTRSEDVFVPLAKRMTIAREAGADLLVSLHADALEDEDARGASVYTLSDDAADGASERVVERHGPSDLIGGVDLSGEDDRVATALMDLARADATPASRRLADAVVAGLSEAGVPVNSHAHREAGLAVLNAPDFPSVLVEMGFLSDESDRERLSTAEAGPPSSRGWWPRCGGSGRRRRREGGCG